MAKKSLIALLVFVAATVLVGCGEQSKDEVQAKAKAQSDYVKAHPDPPGAGASQ